MRNVTLFCILAAAFAAPARAGDISTIAGGNNGAVGDNARDIPIYTSNAIDQIGVGPDGTVYFTDPQRYIAWAATPAGVVTRKFGSGAQGFGGDDGPADQALLNYPYDIAADSAGNVYIADNNNYRIRKVDSNGIITTYAGTGSGGVSGDGGLATAAGIASVTSIGVDGANNLYLWSDNGCQLRKIDATTKIITRIAGKPSDGCGTPTAATPATSGRLGNSYGIGVASNGAVYIAFYSYNSVWRVEPNGASQAAEVTSGLSEPRGVAVMANGVDLLISSRKVYGRIHKWTDATSTLTDVAGNGDAGGSYVEGAPALGNPLYCYSNAVAVDANGNYYTHSQCQDFIRKISGTTGNMTTFAGNGSSRGSSLGGGDPLKASFGEVRSIAVGADGSFYFTSENSQRVHRVTAAGVISVYAGNGTNGSDGDGGLATSAQLSEPAAVRIGPDGNLYIADRQNSRIRVVNKTDGKIDTYRGDGNSSGDTAIYYPWGFDFTSSGSLITDSEQYYGLWEFSATGEKTLIAGHEDSSNEFDLIAERDAVGANFGQPGDLVVSGGNAIFIDRSWYRVRLVDRTTGKIRSIAGTGNYGYNGDGIPARFAPLEDPYGLAANPVGNLLIAERDADRVRLIDRAGLIMTVAGVGRDNDSDANSDQAAPLGDGGPATMASVRRPTAVAWSQFHGGFLVAEGGQRPIRIRKVLDAVPTIGSLTVDPAAAKRGETVGITADASDPETLPSSLEMTLEVKAAGGSTWAAIPAVYDADAGVFRANYVVGAGLALGNAQVRATAGDGLHSTPTSATATLAVSNAPPTIAQPIPDQLVPEGLPIGLDLTAYEKDFEDTGTDLDWTIVLPNGAGAAVDTANSRPAEDFFILKPVALGFSGAITATLRLTDSDGGTAEQTVVFTWLFTGALGAAAPRIASPVDLETVATKRPSIVVHNPGGATSIAFEIHAGDRIGTIASNGTVEVGTAGTTTFTPNADLPDNGTYTARARALQGTEPGPWSTPVTFHINSANDLPGSAVPLSPIGAAPYGARPQFVAAGASDPDGDGLTYIFEVFSDSDAKTAVATSPAVAGNGSTIAWTADKDLAAGTTLYWRVHAKDATGDGPNSILVAFRIQDFITAVAAKGGCGCGAGGSGSSAALFGLIAAFALALRRRRANG